MADFVRRASQWRQSYGSPSHFLCRPLAFRRRLRLPEATAAPAPAALPAAWEGTAFPEIQEALAIGVAGPGGGGAVAVQAAATAAMAATTAAQEELAPAVLELRGAPWAAEAAAAAAQMARSGLRSVAPAAMAAMAVVAVAAAPAAMA